MRFWRMLILWNGDTARAILGNEEIFKYGFCSRPKVIATDQDMSIRRRPWYRRIRTLLRVEDRKITRNYRLLFFRRFSYLVWLKIICAALHHQTRCESHEMEFRFNKKKWYAFLAETNLHLQTLEQDWENC